MIINDTKKVVNTSLFVREPVDEIVNEILSTGDRRIILNGERGVGKSTVLRSLEYRGLGNKEETTILLYPKAEVMPAIEPTERFTSKIFDYYFELYFAQILLWYIRYNYPIVFSKYFKGDLELVNGQLDIFADFWNGNITPENFDPSSKIDSIIAGIMNKFSDLAGLNKINLALNRFDSMNGSSKYAQEFYEKHFNLFNKVILSTEDEHISPFYIQSNGYKFKPINYGADKDILREIVRRRIEYYKFQEKITLDESILTSDEFIDKLGIFNGNLKNIIKVLNDIANSVSAGHKQSDVDIDSTIRNVKIHDDEYKRAYCYGYPKFHLKEEEK